MRDRKTFHGSPLTIARDSMSQPDGRVLRRMGTWKRVGRDGVWTLALVFTVQSRNGGYLVRRLLGKIVRFYLPTYFISTYLGMDHGKARQEDVI